MKLLSALIITLLTLQPTFAAEKFKYNELQIKDYDEMTKKVNEYIAHAKDLAIKYQEDGDDETGDQKAIEALSEALTYILSRPDKDNMVSKLLPLIRKELLNYNSFETSLSLVATDAITALQIKKLPVNYRATYVFVLENIMSQVKPLISTNPEMRSIVQKIADAKIDVGDDVKKDRLDKMFKTRSPSDIAVDLLKTNPVKTTSESKPKPPISE
ncbi:MAG: hypothetical protein KDD34_03150 [Bdellovibrionales bacterium]|nr:hypothetical protein [Bdellovibrionales bacterium]